MCGKFGVWRWRWGGDGKEQTQKHHPISVFNVFNVFRCPHPPPNVAASRLDLKNGRHTSADQASYGNPRFTRVNPREFTCHKENTPHSLLPGYLLGSPRGDKLTHTRTQHCCAGRPCRGGVGKGRRAGQRATPCVTLWSQNL